MDSLRTKLVKLAHRVPELRRHVVPLLRLASTGLDCRIYKATDGHWYMDLEQYNYAHQEGDDDDGGYEEEYDYYGPFDSSEAVLKYLHDNHANPGGYSLDGSGHRRPPQAHSLINPKRRHFGSAASSAAIVHFLSNEGWRLGKGKHPTDNLLYFYQGESEDVFEPSDYDKPDDYDEDSDGDYEDLRERHREDWNQGDAARDQLEEARRVRQELERRFKAHSVYGPGLPVMQKPHDIWGNFMALIVTLP